MQKKKKNQKTKNPRSVENILSSRKGWALNGIYKNAGYFSRTKDFLILNTNKDVLFFVVVFIKLVSETGIIY